MLISPNNCQFGSNFWIRPDEANAFLINAHPKCRQGREWNLLYETLSGYGKIKVGPTTLARHTQGV
jgi:hypothetical protein